MCPEDGFHALLRGFPGGRQPERTGIVLNEFRAERLLKAGNGAREGGGFSFKRLCRCRQGPGSRKAEKLPPGREVVGLRHGLVLEMLIHALHFPTKEDWEYESILRNAQN